MEQEKLLYWGDLKPSESEQHLLEGEYVSDALGDQIETVFSTINRNGQEEPIPIIISAQTGTGKNHFITHELREYAREHGEKILYVSDRLALDYQQKKELHNMLDSLQGFRRVSNSEDLQNYCVFGNVTVITYHKLYKWMISQRQQGADTENHVDVFNFDTNPVSYRYVVLDECHFFYSDAMFYPHTWEILENIPYFFRNSFRIYMTATPEEVQEPIRCCEDNLLGGYGYRIHIKTDPIVDSQFNRINDGIELSIRIDTFEQYQESKEKPGNSFTKNLVYPFVYFLPRDYSNYHRIYFSEAAQVIEKIIQDSSKKKWVVFVDSKTTGKKIEGELRGEKIEAIFFDSTSRSDENDEQRGKWFSLQKNGVFQERVLITTQVLDNGFSLHDAKIENIVLFTHDRTEFLQELGRYRVPKRKTVNVYVRKFTKREFGRIKNRNEEDRTIISNFIGNKISKQVETNQSAEWNENYKGASETVKFLWRAKKPRDYIWFRSEGSALLPQINNMARWHVYRRQLQLKEYEAMLAEDPAQAPILWKERWFYDGGVIPLGTESDYEDLDLKVEALKELQVFLQKYADEGTIFTEPEAGKKGKKGKENKEDTESEEDKEFNSFSDSFQKLYDKAKPGDPSVNLGKNRKPWKASALKSHMKKIDGPVEYSFQSVKDENGNDIKGQYQVIATPKQDETNT